MITTVAVGTATVVIISLPFKLIFFVLVDGWRLIAGSLVQSYMHSPPPTDISVISASGPATFWPGCILRNRHCLPPMMMRPSKSPRLWLFGALFAADLMPALLGAIA